jgi:Ser/Thr protein kinase RdoA (MazF antagonist)
MDVALQAFTHPSLRRNLQWDLALVLGVRAFVPHVTQPDRRALAETWLSEFETAVLPCAAKLLYWLRFRMKVATVSTYIQQRKPLESAVKR